MNKLFKCDLKIQGKGVAYTSKISCSVMYHSDTINNNQTDMFERILEQVFKLVVKEFSQKPIYGEFEIKEPQIDVSYDAIEKDLIENGLNLAQYSLNNDEVKIELTNGDDWCYPNILTEAMKKFFDFHYIELSGANLVHTYFPGRKDIIQQQKSSLRNLLSEYEALTDEINTTIIGAFNAEKRNQMALEEKLIEFEKQLH